MRVLFIHPAYPNQFTAIAHYMGRVQGMECAFLTETSCTAQVQADNVPIPYYGYTRDGDAGNECWYTTCYENSIRHGKGVADIVGALMETHPVDLVIGHASFGTTFFLKEMFQLPVISYIELPGYHMAWCREEYPLLSEHRFLNTAFQSLVYSSVVNSDRVIVPSLHAKGFFPAELQGKIRVQMEGFCLPPLYPDKRLLRKMAGLPEEGAIVGFSGRTLEAVRGFDIFVRVAKMLKQRRPDLHFLVIGSETTLYGNELTYLEGKSFKRYILDETDLGDDFFIFREYLEYDNFHKYLQTMDLFLFPQFEGAANWGLFEAMASGLPVIASNRCFIPEVIRQGVNGWMFDPYDVGGIVAKCMEILSGPEVNRYLGENARQTIRERYSVEQSVAGYLSVIDEVMEERNTDLCN